VPPVPSLQRWCVVRFEKNAANASDSLHETSEVGWWCGKVHFLRRDFKSIGNFAA
jgi:hypothetical protein